MIAQGIIWFHPQQHTSTPFVSSSHPVLIFLDLSNPVKNKRSVGEFIDPSAPFTYIHASFGRFIFIINADALE